MKHRHRWTAFGLALCAGALLALSVQAGRWWSLGEVEWGPFGTRSPFAGGHALSWAGGSARWARFGVATWSGALIATFLLAMVAAALAARRVPRLAAMTALVAIATATLAAIGFVATRPDLPFAIDRGIVFFAAGIVTGVAAAILVVRARPRTG